MGSEIARGFYNKLKEVGAFSHSYAIPMPSFSAPGQPFFPGGSNPPSGAMAERRSSAVDRAAQTNLETWKTAHPICLQTFVLCFFTVCFISCHLFIPKGCKAGSLCTFPEVLVVSWTIFGPSKGCSSATSCWDNCC